MKLLLSLLLFCSTILFAQEEIKHDVYFDTDKYEVPLTEENRLLLFISKVDTLPIDKISIYGFTDDRGTNDYNIVLSQNRANTIKSFFEGSGLDPNLITNVNGKGEILLRILTEDQIHKIRGLNRKVEISVALLKPESKPELVEEAVVDTIIGEKAPREKVVEISEIKPSLKTTDDILNKKLQFVVGDKIRLDKIFFKTSYSYVTSDSKPTLKKVAELLKKYPNVYFSIQGHVCCTKYTRDAVDKKTGQRNLSLTRAKYVYDFFVKVGVDPKRMKYAGLRRRYSLGGEPKKDRRVELIITKVL